MFCSVWGNFLLRVDSLALKSVFVMKFTCAYLAAKCSVVSLLNSGVVIYLSWLWSVIFFSILLNFVNFCVSFLTKLLKLGILCSTAVNAEVVAKPLMLSILFSISLILEL